LLWFSTRLFAPAIFLDTREPALLQTFLSSKTGVFVEVGANDPIAGSQTYALEQRGWSGLLVEPLREYADQLRSARTAKVVCGAAGSPTEAGTLSPLIVAGTLSTLDSLRQPKIEANEIRLVPVQTLDAMLRDARVSDIDFLSIDVEGHELEVLRGFSIERYRPPFILLEDQVLDRSYHNYLTARGYVLVRRTGLNNWYLTDPSRLRVSVFGRLQLFRKLWLGAALRRWRYNLKHRASAKAIVALFSDKLRLSRTRARQVQET